MSYDKFPHRKKVFYALLPIFNNARGHLSPLRSPTLLSIRLYLIRWHKFSSHLFFIALFLGKPQSFPFLFCSLSILTLLVTGLMAPRRPRQDTTLDESLPHQMVRTDDRCRMITVSVCFRKNRGTDGGTGWCFNFGQIYRSVGPFEIIIFRNNVCLSSSMF